MSSTDRDLESVRARLHTFVDERDWHQFHTPKNLAMALAGEVGELLAELQWLTDAEILTFTQQEGGGPGERINHEIADVLLCLVRLADVCGVDLISAAHAKIALNETKYPADLARGNARKYTELAHEVSQEEG
jgi:NTP pyrophosphatase (non-canonical NTP hydrolase)